MQFAQLLRDATESEASASIRSQQIALANLLNTAHPEDAITPKGVEKWFARRTIPGKWLLRIAALRTPPLNLSLYA